MRSLKSVSSWKICFSVAQFLCFAVCYVSSEQGADSLSYNTKTQLSTPEECARICRDNETPKTCYFHFTLELYVTLGAACLNGSTSAQCVTADGVERSFLAVNRKLPGSSIQVCEHDKVVVDVFNKIPGQEVTIHWHGIHQRDTQYYDGMPFVTQCPIPQGTTFRYWWKANRGTHFWHSHSGLQKFDGLHGSLIVRQTRSRDPHAYKYDFDLPEHVIELSDWSHDPASTRFPGLFTNNTGGETRQLPINYLINGCGKSDPVEGIDTHIHYAVFIVKYGYKYRLRIIASLSTVCPVQLTIEKHLLILIAIDGEPVKPVAVNTLTFFSGERCDVVLFANQSQDSYWIQLRGIGECTGMQQLATLQYKGASKTPSSRPPTYEAALPLGVMLNSVLASCNRSNPNGICISDLKHAEAVDTGILKQEPDVKIFLPFRFWFFTPEQLFVKNKYTTFLVNNQVLLNSVLNNISYTSPPSPLISQRKDIPADQLCNDDNRPAYCGNRSNNCACTHLLEIPLNAIVEIVLMDIFPIPFVTHPFHLHGYSFYILLLGVFPNYGATNEQMQAVMDLDREEILRNQSYKPPSKDVLAIPNNGYAIIRFKANNPGYWMLHCHFLFHIVTGMNIVLQVGEQKDLPPVPSNFPRCGNFLPPITAPYS